MTTRPNLFNYATSELSQDGFICWLLAWSDPSQQEEDPMLHQAGTSLLRALLVESGYALAEPINQVTVKKQYQNIDILVVVNEKIPLIIEDKVDTKNHSGQLKRYQEIVQQDFEVSDVPAVYFKTGDQSRYDAIRAIGYGVFGRRQFLEILRAAMESGVNNTIFHDFYDYLSAIEESVLRFATLPVDQWEPCSSCWKGFFIELQELLQTGNWDYVPNASGGFYGFWWNGRDKRYLQLEEGKLCFKLEVEDEREQTSQRNAWHKRLVAAGKRSTLTIRKPTRFGKGRCMTAALLDGDYRQCDARGLLDLDATVGLLHEVEMIMEDAFSAE